jgi:tryptophan 7-halogenase
VTEHAIRSVAIAGGGIVGLSAAIAFARVLPGTSITLVETSPDPAALSDLLPTARPGVARFHPLIGLDETDLVGSGIATYHLGSMFERWPQTREPWTYAFGQYGKPADAIPFDQIWVRAHRAGKALAYDRYSVGAALARAGKFIHPAKDSEFIGSRFQYGLRFDPDCYRERLRSQAGAANVVLQSGDIGEIEPREDGGIAALQLTNGTRVEADLFVDCTGPSARLLTALDDSFEDWSDWMPFGRVALGSGPADAPPPTADRVAADDDGWSAEWPLSGRTMNARIGNDEGVPIARGRRLRPWVHNVLALGDAATALDPLHGFHLELAHGAILLALELLPTRDFHPVETAEYNRRAELLTRRVRDFIALHYVRSGWTNAEPPDSLARTLDQYEHRGRMPFHEEESLSRDSWTAALLGLGVIPRHTDPQALAVALDQAVPAMQKLAGEIDQAVASVPSYADYLARITR